jgi:hypothetical protein
MGCLCLAVLAACSESTTTAPLRPSSATALPASPRYIVQLNGPGEPSPAFVAAVRRAGGQVLHTQTKLGLALVRGLTPAAAMALRSEAGVHAIMPDYVVKLRPPLAFQRLSASSLRRGSVGAAGAPGAASAEPQQWNMQVTHADSAWQITSQGLGKHVYVLDSGVDTLQQELVGRLDLVNSTSFAYAPTDTQELNPLPFGHDVVGHGTFVTSVVTTNSIVIAGTAPQATVTMVRILDDSGGGDFFSALDGIMYAADNNADVINLSIGGYFNRGNSFDLATASLLELVIEYAIDRGVFVVAAAGNEGVNFNTAQSGTVSYADSLEWPGGTPHVLSVGATGPYYNGSSFFNYDSIASYSNYGSQGVGVFAPGGNPTSDTASASETEQLIIGACSSATTLCPGMENQYLIGAGTSFASPLVAGEAAVIKANASSALTPVAIENCIINNADAPTGKNPDPAYNHGRVNVVRAVTASGCH